MISGGRTVMYWSGCGALSVPHHYVLLGGLAISLSQVCREGSLTGVTDLAVSRSKQALYALAPGATRVMAFELGADGPSSPPATAAETWIGKRLPS